MSRDRIVTRNINTVVTTDKQNLNMEEIKNFMITINEKLEKMQENSVKTDMKINDLVTKVTKMEDTAVQVKINSDKIESLEFEIKMLKEQIKSNEDNRLKDKQKHDEEFDTHDNRMRRSNVVISGLPESEPESWDMVEQKVQSLIKDKLNLELENVVDRAHRVGHKRDGVNRPIVVLLKSYKDKVLILRNSIKLKSTGIFINDDFSYKVRKQRTNLLRFAKTQGSKYKLVYNKLHIADKTYVDSDKGITLVG